MAASSSSSTDGGAALAAGTAVVDFTVERVLGEGPRGIVYEATQAGLRRRVALKVYRRRPGLAARFDALRWPEHPHVASLYAAGECEHGFFTATRLIRGPTLAELIEQRTLEPGRVEQLCDEVGRALAAAHGAGIVHGAVHAGNVFVDVGVDGRALLTDFVSARDAAPAEDDAALARMRARCLHACHAARTTRRAPRRSAAAVALVVFVALGVVAGALLVLPPAAPAPVGAPAPAAGVVALGSSLAAPAARSVTCDGEPVNGSSLPCIVMQTRLPGRRVVVSQDGVVRGWFVRGAVGEVALHMLRPRGRRFVSVGRSALQRVPDGDDVHPLAASLAVRRGDRIAVEVTPGAAIGIGPGATGAATMRFIAPRRAIPMTPTADLPARFDHELLVRVDYAPGARLAWPSALAGQRAARAPAGRVLARHVVSAGDRTRTVVLVSLEDRIALDLFAGARRLMRVAIPEADPAGRLVRTEVSSLPDVTVIWENAEGIVTTSFRIGVSRLTAT